MKTDLSKLSESELNGKAKTLKGVLAATLSATIIIVFIIGYFAVTGNLDSSKLYLAVLLVLPLGGSVPAFAGLSAINEELKKRQSS